MAVAAHCWLCQHSLAECLPEQVVHRQLQNLHPATP
jgi:hypothetical protein